MRNGVRYCWVLLFVACGLGGCRGETPATTVSKSAADANTLIHPNKTQLVTVVTDDWDRFQATLGRYERSPGQVWKPVGAPIDVVLGREGYGWGRGIHGNGAPAGRRGPIKREGDGPIVVTRVDADGEESEVSYDDGIAKEREVFAMLRDGPQGRALRHAFFADRELRARVQPEHEELAADVAGNT